MVLRGNFGGIRPLIQLLFNIFTNDEFELPKTRQSFTTRNKTVMKKLTQSISLTFNGFDLFVHVIIHFFVDIFPSLYGSGMWPIDGSDFYMNNAAY